jgi:small-conductance mechanosensitive channel
MSELSGRTMVDRQITHSVLIFLQERCLRVTTSRQTKHNWLSNLIRVLLFVAALYIAYKILKPLLIFFLSVSFWLIKVIVFIAVSLIIIHLFLKLIFGLDLWQKLGIPSWWK